MINIIVDDMKKESKKWLVMTIVFYILSIVWPLAARFMYQGDDVNISDLILGFLAFFLMGCIALYGYLYSKKYKVEITNHHLKIYTLFKKVKLTIDHINQYKVKKYGLGVFYQFDLTCDEKKYRMYTKYVDELKRILDSNIHR